MVRVPASTLLPSCPALGKFKVCAQFQPGTQVNIQPGSHASKGVDLRHLISTRAVTVADENGQPASEAFLEAVRAAGQRNQDTRVSWRWLVTVAEDGRPHELQLQSLAGNLEPVLLATLPVQVPVPAEGTAATGLNSSSAGALNSSSEGAHSDCQAFEATEENCPEKTAEVPREGRSAGPPGAAGADSTLPPAGAGINPAATTAQASPCGGEASGRKQIRLLCIEMVRKKQLSWV